jgi:hypothetical protein
MAEMIAKYSFKLSMADAELLERIMKHEHYTNRAEMLGLMLGDYWLAAQQRIRLQLSREDREDFRPFIVVPEEENSFRVSKAESERIMKMVTSGQQRLSEWISRMLIEYVSEIKRQRVNNHKSTALSYIMSTMYGADLLRQFE